MDESTEQKQKLADDSVASHISSFNDFMTWVDSLEELLQKMNGSRGRSRFELYFRGVDNDSYPSDDPSIFRDFGWIRNENILINECLSKNPRDFSEDRTTFDVLVRMQHYGLPTRLLDITKNPLVALYFATKNGEKENGKVVAYFVSDKKIYYPNSPLVALYSNLSYQDYEQWRFESKRETVIRDLIRRASSDVFASDEFYSSQNLEGCCCVKPKMTNERIIRQDGAFLLFGMSFNKEFCPKIFPMEDYLKVDLLARALFLLKESSLDGRFESQEEIESFVEREIENSYSKCYEEYEWKHVEETARREVEKERNEWTKGFSLSVKYFFCLDKKEKRLREELNRNFSRMKYSGFEDIVTSEEVEECRKKFDDAFLKYSRLQSIKEYLKGNGYVMKIESGISEKGKIQKNLERLGITKDKLFPELEVRANILKERFKE